jgi:FixJ family two-component response regulator
MRARSLGRDVAGGAEGAMAERTLISIVEDDEPFRESMRKLVMLLGYTVEAFASPADFLKSPLVAETDCLVADVQMPGMTGVELHKHLV